VCESIPDQAGDLIGCTDVRLGGCLGVAYNSSNGVLHRNGQQIRRRTLKKMGGVIGLIRSKGDFPIPYRVISVSPRDGKVNPRGSPKSGQRGSPKIRPMKSSTSSASGRRPNARKGTIFISWGLCPQTPGIYRLTARMADEADTLAQPQDCSARSTQLTTFPLAGFEVILVGRIAGDPRGRRAGRARGPVDGWRLSPIAPIVELTLSVGRLSMCLTRIEARSPGNYWQHWGYWGDATGRRLR
jgi:hypothetical protein